MGFLNHSRYGVPVLAGGSAQQPGTLGFDSMKALGLGFFLLLASVQWAGAQPIQDKPASTSFTKAEQEIVDLSKAKWLWMAEKNVDSLNALFDDKCVFVHMGGTWGKTREMEVIKGGTIWYKKAEVYSVSVNMFGNTAILLNDIDLQAVVGGNEVTNAFMVTEVYIKEDGKWKMGSLTFSHLVRPVKMK